ncbi:acyl-phosphate glycerol 3-phosphate acyltransferase [Lachnospiraceae bacterium 10-1]|nr:acyl-phosphate glycerol 3-phosphate acyltransferase [Lachnospiraceae bacterium 10-1]
MALGGHPLSLLSGKERKANKVERLICIAIGYVFGLFQTAFIYGKLHGIDIRQHGSGNAGTTNTLRVLGTKAGLIVLLGDILKCIFAIVICGGIFDASHQDEIYLLKLYAASGAILGHNFPFYLNFKGGKGIAATAGLILSFHPAFIPMGVILFFGAFFITHYVSLGSLLVYAGLMIEMIVAGQMGLFGSSQTILIEMYIITALLTILAYYKHRENIVRLIKGEERKTYLTKKNKQ